MEGKLAKTLGFLTAFGVGAAAYQEANAQDYKNGLNAPKGINRIIAKEDLSVADSSRFLVSTYTPLEISKNTSYDLPSKLGSEDVIGYRVMNPNGKKDAETLANDLKKVNFAHLRKQYLESLKEARESAEYFEYLNEAFKDGKLDSSDFYMLKEGTYFVEVKTPSQSVIRIVKVKPGKLEKKLAGEAETKFEEGKLKSEPKGTVGDSSGNSSYVAPIDSSFYETKGDTIRLLTPYAKLNPDQKGLWISEFYKFFGNKKIKRVGPRAWVRLEDAVKEDLPKDSEEGIGFGPRTWVSNNGEVGSEVFFNHPILGKLKLGGFLGWSAKTGKNYFENQRQSYNLVTRNVKNISPTITETGVDESFYSTESRTKPVAEAGVELSYPIGEFGELSFGIGVKALKEMTKANTRNLSTITQEQNMVQIGQQELTDNLPTVTGEKNKFVPSWRMMTYADLTDWLKLFATVQATKDSQPNYGAGVSIDIGRILD